MKLLLLKRIFKTQLKKYLSDFIIIFFLIILTALSTAVVAWLLDPAIKKIFLEKDQKMLYLIPIAIVIAFFIKSISVFFQRIKTINIAFKIGKDIQLKLAEKILKSDTSYLINKHSGKFISNFTNDTNVLVQVIYTVAINAVKEFFTLIFLVSLMISKNLELSILALCLIPLAAFFSRKLGKRMGKAVVQSLTASEIFTKSLSEILKATSIIKIFQRENYELTNFEKVIQDRITSMSKVEKTRLGSGPIMETITGFAIAIVVFVGGIQSIYGTLEIGSFLSFLAALMLAYQPVRALAGINISTQEALTAAKRIYEILDNQILIQDHPSAKKLEIKNSSINFENVSMSYDGGEIILDNITMSLPGKSKVALVGPSGGGKTTLINLIPRFYDYKKGNILIDEQNIKNVTLSSLRKEIALVSQDVILFDDTIRSNIQYGNQNASMNEIVDACIKANCHEFIEEFKDKYETLVGENGVKLSGGQKQRISIARAIIKNSSIILLDEATSALDTDSEKKVQEALDNLTKQKTTIIIAHRLSTVKNVDKIYVIEKGKVVEEGNHNYLIENSILYKKLCEQQTL